MEEENFGFDVCLVFFFVRVYWHYFDILTGLCPNVGFASFSGSVAVGAILCCCFSSFLQNASHPTCQLEVLVFFDLQLGVFMRIVYWSDHICSQTTSTLARYALGPDSSFFTMASFAKWLFSQSTYSYDEKLAALSALNNLSSTAALSSESVVTIGVVKKICGSLPCDRRLGTLADRFKTSVRQLLEHNHRYTTHFQF